MTGDAAATDLAGLRIGLLTSWASRQGGGVFEAVAAQASLIRAAGGEARVFALADRFAAADADRFAPSLVSHAEVVGPAMIGFAPRLTNMLEAAELDCLHLHGIWMYPSAAAARWTARTARPCLISPHGMLAPWITARGRIKKHVARLAYERASWRGARALHALTDSEATDIARETGRDPEGGVIVIPNAAPPALPRVLPPGTTLPPPTLVSIGRIHPKKNLDALLAAWTRLRPTLPAELAAARLTIAGWGEPAHVAAFERAVAAAGPGVAFVGPVYGEAKARLLGQARFVVLPSHSEGLPMAILEAWAAGVPTVMSAACNLGIGFARGAAIDSGSDVDAIAIALARALTLPEERWRAMAGAAHALAQGPFAPSTVQAAWTNAYRSLVARA